jgi:hypothetical protein
VIVLEGEKPEPVTIIDEKPEVGDKEIVGAAAAICVKNPSINKKTNNLKIFLHPLYLFIFSLLKIDIVTPIYL